MATLSGFAEAMIWSSVFVFVVGLMTISLNVTYNENFSYGYNDSSGAFQRLIGYQDTAKSYTTGGQVNFDTQGISLDKSWQMFLDISTIAGDFITGGFITNITNGLNLGLAGKILGTTMRLLWILTLFLFLPLLIMFQKKGV